MPGFACSNAAAIAFSEAASEFVPQNEKLMSAVLFSPPLLAAGWLPVAQPAASSTAAITGIRRLGSIMRGPSDEC